MPALRLAALLLFLFLFTCPVGHAATDAGHAAIDQNLQSGWWFYRYDTGQSFDQALIPAEGWHEVTLPHTARLEPRVVNDQWQGDALYRRTLLGDPGWQGKAVWLRFEGAMMAADIYLNGERIFQHEGGYLPFTVDLSGQLLTGKTNEILVHLDNRDNPLTGPKPLEILDFNTYGGLYREVRLMVRDNLHITDEILAGKVAGGGLFVTYPQVSAERAVVAIKTHVRNTGDQPRRFSVSQELFSGDVSSARAASAGRVLQPGEDLEDLSQLELMSPRLWSPDSPDLYRLVTRIVTDDGVVDERITTLGIRRITFEKNRLSINGDKRFLRGVNRHQEYPYVGYALSAAADYRDAKLIKEAGFDYVRLSHYPHSPHFMQAADELGLVLVNAILGWQYFNPDPAFSDHVEQTCRDLVRRDRNHPSVIAWECSLNESAMPENLVGRLHRAVHEEYPGDQAFSAGWMRGYDIFLQARQHRLQHYEEPGQPYIVSEYGDWEYYAQNAGLQQDQWDGLKEEERTSRQALGSGEKRLLQQATNGQEAHNDNFSTPAFADGYWVMFDYNRGYADDLETSGIMSIERVPKFSYHFFRSQRGANEKSPRFRSGPMLKIASYWDAASSQDVRIFSNVEEVELRLNGKSLGRQKADRDRISDFLAYPPFTFRLDGFEPGRLQAIGYIGNVEVARDTVTTPGNTAGIELLFEDQGVPATPGDLVFLRARLVDGNGMPVPASGTSVAFSTNCPATAARFLGPPSVSTEAGLASVLVKFVEPGPSCSFSASVEGQAWTDSLQATGGRQRSSAQS